MLGKARGRHVQHGLGVEKGEGTHPNLARLDPALGRQRHEFRHILVADGRQQDLHILLARDRIRLPLKVRLVQRIRDLLARLVIDQLLQALLRRVRHPKAADEGLVAGNPDDRVLGGNPRLAEQLAHRLHKGVAALIGACGGFDVRLDTGGGGYPHSAPIAHRFDELHGTRSEVDAHAFCKVGHVSVRLVDWGFGTTSPALLPLLGGTPYQPDLQVRNAPWRLSPSDSDFSFALNPLGARNQAPSGQPQTTPIVAHLSPSVGGLCQPATICPHPMKMSDAGDGPSWRQPRTPSSQHPFDTRHQRPRVRLVLPLRENPHDWFGIARPKVNPAPRNEELQPVPLIHFRRVLERLPRPG